MKITTEMLDAAMKKATEAGLLPRHARREDVAINRDLIRMVLTAALESERNHVPAAVPNAAGGQGTEPIATDGSRLPHLPKLAAGVY